VSPGAPRSASWRRDPRSGLLAIAFGVAITLFVLLTAAVLLMPSFLAWDATVSAAIRDISLPGLEAVARFFTLLGSTLPIVVMTAAIAIYLVLRGRKAEALLLVLTVAIGSLLGETLKVLVHRARPAVEYARIATPSSYSFPSGHALTAVDFFGTLGFIVLIGKSRLKRSALIVVVFVMMALAIGLSRVYLGVHYMGDVLAGCSLGAAWVTFMILIGATWGAGTAEKD